MPKGGLPVRRRHLERLVELAARAWTGVPHITFETR
jgi:hypothetical protein